MEIYRYEKVCYHEELRGWENENNVEIILREFKIIRNTPKGYVIKLGSKEKWVSSTGKKRFAYKLKDDALTNFIKRTNRSILMMKHSIDYAELALLKVNELFNQKT
jgi:hypothetical protein